MAIGVDTLIAENERLRSEKAALVSTVQALQQALKDLARDNLRLECQPVIVSPFTTKH